MDSFSLTKNRIIPTARKLFYYTLFYSLRDRNALVAFNHPSGALEIQIQARSIALLHRKSGASERRRILSEDNSWTREEYPGMTQAATDIGVYRYSGCIKHRTVASFLRPMHTLLRN